MKGCDRNNMMKKIMSFIKKQSKNTYAFDTRATASFFLASFIITMIFASIAISGRPSGASWIHLSLDFVIAWAINGFLFIVCIFLLAFMFTLLRIPIARLALSSVIYAGLGIGVVLYYVDAGTIFSIMIALLFAIVTTVLAWILHLLRVYRLHKLLLLFTVIGLAILALSSVLTTGKQHEAKQTGPYDVDFFTYGSGKDPYRKDFGVDVTEITERVDASELVTNWPDKRSKFWEFDQNRFPLNGRVFMPKGEGPFPIIFMVHGNHTMEKFSTGGYDYLGQALASHGFIFISVDEDFINYSNITGQPNDNYTLRTWVLLQHIVQVKKMNEDENSLFFEKVNLEEIALSGHSRGGQAAAMGADYERFIEDPILLGQLKDVEIKAVAAISPTDKSIDHTKAKLEDVSYLVMHGAQDADVYNFRGDHQYYRTQLTKADQIKAALYIENANHVQFNDDWGRFDLAMPKGLFLNQLDLLSKDEQQDIAITYLTAFYKDVFYGEKELETLIEDEELRAERLPNTSIIQKYEGAAAQPLLSYSKHQEILGEFSNIKKKEVIRPKNRSGGIHPKDALQLSWEEEASYKLPLSYTKLKKLDGTLLLSIANNQPGSEIRMTVSLSHHGETILEETKEISPVIEIEQTPFGALDAYYRDGKYEVSWEPVFESVRIPVQDLPDLNMQDLVLELDFSGEKGQVLLEEIAWEYP